MHTMNIYSNYIGMSFGNIPDIEDSYKYLGILQANRGLEDSTRKSSTGRYFQRVRQVLRSQFMEGQSPMLFQSSNALLGY